MARSTKKKRRKPSGSGIKSGMAPGTMVFIGEQRQEQARIDLMQYNGTGFDEIGNVTVRQCVGRGRKTARHHVDECDAQRRAWFENGAAGWTQEKQMPAATLLEDYFKNKLL